jgi:hypothetical protein
MHDTCDFCGRNTTPKEDGAQPFCEVHGFSVTVECVGDYGPCKKHGCIHFACPVCGAKHNRGYVDGVSIFRCLKCGYTGHGLHPDPEIDSEVWGDIQEAEKFDREHGLDAPGAEHGIGRMKAKVVCVGEQKNALQAEIASLRARLAEAQTAGLKQTFEAAELDKRLAASEARAAKLEGAVTAARALVERMDTVHHDPYYIGVWTLHQVHGGTYRGPTYNEAYAALRAALAAVPAPQPAPAQKVCKCGHQRQDHRSADYGVCGIETCPCLKYEPPTPASRPQEGK